MGIILPCRGLWLALPNVMKAKAYYSTTLGTLSMDPELGKNGCGEVVLQGSRELVECFNGGWR
jgi:hypothetical protein